MAEKQDWQIDPYESCLRPKPQSRLGNFHGVDYHEQEECELSYLHKRQDALELSNTSLGSVSLTPLREEITSTPYNARGHAEDLAKQLENFSLISNLESPVDQRFQCYKEHADDIHGCKLRPPLPRISLETLFEENADCGDSTGENNADSAYYSYGSPLEKGSMPPPVISPWSLEKPFNIKSVPGVSAEKELLDASFKTNSDSGLASFNERMSELCKDLPDDNDTSSNATMETKPAPSIKTVVARKRKWDQYCDDEESEDGSSSSEDVRYYHEIGQCMGEATLDVLMELQGCGALPCLDLILEYLHVNDLGRMMTVSHGWRELIQTNYLAFKRVWDYKRILAERAKIRENNKENLYCHPLRRCRRRAAKVLGDVSSEMNVAAVDGQPLVPEPTSPTPPASGEQEQPQFPDEPVIPDCFYYCPKCRNYARCDPTTLRPDASSIVAGGCDHVFCTHCNETTHHPEQCTYKKSRLAGPEAGSDKSKKNLKRL